MLDPKIIAQHYIIAALWADAPEGTNSRAPRDQTANICRAKKRWLAQ